MVILLELWLRNMSRKGFTLVELLAVLVVLGILTTIATTTILKQIKDSNNKLNDAQMEIVKSSSIEYADKKGFFKKDGSSYNVCINDLKLEGLIDNSIVSLLDENKSYYVKLSVKCDGVCIFDASDVLEDNDVVCN